MHSHLAETGKVVHTRLDNRNTNVREGGLQNCVHVQMLCMTMLLAHALIPVTDSGPPLLTWLDVCCAEVVQKLEAMIGCSEAASGEAASSCTPTSTGTQDMGSPAMSARTTPHVLSPFAQMSGRQGAGLVN